METAEIQVQTENIPDELRTVPRWVTWKNVVKKGETKPSKVLFDPNTGKYGNSTDPAKWTDFDGAVGAYQDGGYTGIGIVFVAEDDLMGVDLDHCLDGDTLTDWAAAIVEQLDSYTEISPSGTGLKIFIRAKKPGATCKKIIDHETEEAVEIYEKTRYFTVTGNRWPGTPATVEPRHDELNDLYHSLFTPSQNTPQAAQSLPVATDTEQAENALQRLSAWRCDDYDSWLRVGMALTEVPNGLQLWDAWSSDSSKYTPGICEKKWATFTPGDGITILTLFKWANEDDPGGAIRRNGTGPGAAGYDGQDTEGILEALNGASAPTFTPSQMLLGELGNLGYTFAQNDLDNGIYVNDELLEDGLEADIKTQIRDIYSNLTQSDDTRPKWRVSWLVDTYTGAAYRNKFHPVRDYLNSLKWDEDRFYIRELANHFTGTDEPIVYTVEGERARTYTLDTVYVYLRKWMIGTVAKVLNPSAQTQVPMLVIVGKQGDGKSTFAQWLGSPLPELTIESAIQPDNPEHARYLSTKWIWEVAELGSTTRRADVEALKAFITKIDSTFRKPYDKYPMVKPALSSFIGTVNDGIGFLNDISGNRRFHVARVSNIDWGYINNIDIHQVWAEAVHAYRDGESWQLSKEEVAHRDKLNSQHETEDALEGWILKYFEINETKEEWLTQSSEIVSTIQSMGVTGGTKAIQNGVASYLKRRGLAQHWTRPRKWIGIKAQDWVIQLREDAKKKG